MVPDAVVTLAGGSDIRLVASMTPALARRAATDEQLDGLDPKLLITARGNPGLATWIAPAPAGAVGFATPEGSVAVYDALMAAGYRAIAAGPSARHP